MTDRELDAWIAEHVMGWTAEDVVWSLTSCHVNTGEKCPYFSTDLNDTAQAEAKIAKMGRAVGEAYAEAIREIYTDSPDCPNAYKEAAWAGWATARQRCEAMYAIREHIERAAA